MAYVHGRSCTQAPEIVLVPAVVVMAKRKVTRTKIITAAMVVLGAQMRIKISLSRGT